MNKYNKTYKMVYMGLLVSMALALSLIERMLPVPFIAPGAKLGLANLIIVISVYTLDSYKDSFIILILRIILASTLGGSLSSLLYSISGGILSFIATILVKNLGKNSRGLSRVEAGNPGFPRLVQVTSGGFSWWL